MLVESESHQPEAESILMPDRAKTFAWAAQFLPKRVREDLALLYSFCRYVDDGVDNCADREVATEFLDRINLGLEANCSADEQVIAFLKLSNSRGMPLSFALDLVRGVRTDIGMEQMRSLEELLRYSYQVAGTVGIMICYLLEVSGSDALAAAIDLGIAMQLTNIARDIREDFAQGRIYLPASLIDKSTVAEALSGSDSAQVKVIAVTKEIIAISQTYYRSSEKGICFLPADFKLSILCASRAYNHIGTLIVKKPERVFTERVCTGAGAKTFCLLTSLLSLTLPKYHLIQSSSGHASELHRSLKGLPSFDVVYR